MHQRNAAAYPILTQALLLCYGQLLLLIGGYFDTLICHDSIFVVHHSSWS